VKSEKIRILIIDDDPGDFQMARAMIDAVDRPDTEYEVEWASSWQEAAESFQNDRHDVYFVDYFLEDRDGLAVVREARALGVREPLIMLTGRGSHEVDLEAMEAGASDYLVKGRLDPDLLERTIRYALERYQSQRTLLESEERHRGMFDHLPVGLYRCAPDGAFLDANPALVRLLGHPDTETLARRYARFFYVAPDQHEAFRQALETYGVVRGLETVLEKVDGTHVRVRNTARAHRGASGDTEYVEGVVEDVTHLESVKHLEGVAERFEAIYEHSRLALVLLDGEGRVVEANPAFLRAFGYSADDFSGKPFIDLSIPSDRSALERDLAAVTDGQIGRTEGELRMTARDGTVLWTRLQVIGVTDTDGRGVKALALLEELSEAAQRR
jgi:PAS domain S-box-containing protein